MDAPTFYLYKILGLGNSAPTADIKEAYKQHITKHNPDNYPGASDVIKLVQHAYEVLSNYETRRIYDLFCTHILYNGGADNTCTGSHQMFMYPKPEWVAQKNDIVHVVDMSIRNVYQGKKTKVVTKDACVEVDIARGTKDGQRLVYRGKGLRTTGGLPGDLVIIINRIDYPFFLQKSIDLFCKIDIDEKVAQGGGEIF
ncbi:mitochondrial protein import protein MAS5, partial [Coemansia sp. RSA 2399]